MSCVAADTRPGLHDMVLSVSRVALVALVMVALGATAQAQPPPSPPVPVPSDCTGTVNNNAVITQEPKLVNTSLHGKKVRSRMCHQSP